MRKKQDAAIQPELDYDDKFNPDKAVPLLSLCKICGISKTTGERKVQDGTFVSSMTIGRGNKALYPLRENVLRFFAKKEEKVRAENQAEDTEELKAKKLKAEIELKQSQGELHQLKTEIAKGNYISTEDVALDYQRFFVLFKKFAMAIPARVGGYIAGYVDPVVERGIEKDIQREICSMLRNFVVAGHTPPEEGGTK